VALTEEKTSLEEEAPATSMLVEADKFNLELMG